MSTYDYYRIFYHVAQQHSFTKAAEVLHNNQPNITRCMNNLETELGCHLFVRSNRGVSLTPEGQKLFNHVAIAFEQLELGETELKRDQSLTSSPSESVKMHSVLCFCLSWKHFTIIIHM